MGSCCIQIGTRNTRVESELMERYGQEIKKKNDNVRIVTLEERCGDIVNKEERGR